MLLFALSYKNVKKGIGKKLINFAFTHLKKQNEMSSRLGWTIAYEWLYFVHLNLGSSWCLGLHEECAKGLLITERPERSPQILEKRFQAYQNIKRNNLFMLSFQSIIKNIKLF